MAASSSSKDDRPSKLQKLDTFKRKLPYISASALAAFLSEVKESGPPELGNRKQIQEATEHALKNTAYGPMLSQSPAVQLDGQTKGILYVNPLSLLTAAVEQGGSFSELMPGALQEKGCSFEKPFHVLLYADEVVPGNVLGHHVTRKVWCFYMSILEFGPLQLQKEQAWLTVMIQRTSIVNALAAGVSQLYKILLRAIFLNPSCQVSHGLAVKVQGSVKHIYLDFGGILQDGGAHKNTWSVKGDGGTRFCPLCLNLVSSRSNLVSQDGETILTSDMHFCSNLVLASNVSIWKSIDTLAKKKGELTQHNFKLWEQAAGYNFEPEGLLFDKELRLFVKPADHFLHDYMHCILCNGIMATVLNLLLKDLDVAKVDFYQMFQQYLEFWSLPRFMNTSSLGSLFTPKKRKANKDANTFKASAGEFLGLYPILTYFLQQIVLPSGTCPKQCIVFVELSNLLDMLQSIPLGKITPKQIADSVDQFFQALVAAEWVAYFHSKFHWLVHFAGHLSKLGCLPSCFCHERKHRTVKRFLQAVTNTAAYEKSVLQETVAQDLFDIRKEGIFASHCSLQNKGAASKQFTAFLSEHIAFELCYTCATLLLHPTGKVSKTDFALYKDSNGMLGCGEVWLHCEVDGRLWTLLSVWKLESYCSNTCSAIWTKTESNMLLDSQNILCPLTWQKHGPQKIVTLIPMPFRP